jgi:hypothetical protein
MLSGVQPGHRVLGDGGAGLVGHPGHRRGELPEPDVVAVEAADDPHLVDVGRNPVEVEVDPPRLPAGGLVDSSRRDRSAG